MGPRTGLDGCGKSRPPQPGFDPRTVEPVASRYSDSLRPTSDKYDNSKSPCSFYTMLLLMVKDGYVDCDDVVVRFASVTR